jgi:branched-chain amino acid transport system permease protein
MGLERVVIRPILGQPAFSIVMLTIGIGYVARGLVTMIPGIGTETYACPCPTRTKSGPGRLVLNVEQLVVIAATAVLCVLLYALFRFTKLGIAMQAASQNQLAAYYMGIPASASTAWCGAWRPRWPPSRACCWRPSPSCTPTWASSA